MNKIIRGRVTTPKSHSSNQTRASIATRRAFLKTTSFGFLGALTGCMSVTNRQEAVLRDVTRNNLGEVAQDQQRLRAHIEKLCEFLPRDYSHPENLHAAANYIRGQFEIYGLKVSEQKIEFTAKDSAKFPMRRFQACEDHIFIAKYKDKPPVGTIYRNVIVDIAPKDPAKASLPPLVLGGHYDAVIISPGADDNGSGIAVLLEVARTLAKSPPAVPVRLVAWTNEEVPLGRSPLWGARQFVEQMLKDGKKVQGAIAMDMVGCFYDDTQNVTQKLSFPVSLSRKISRKADYIGVLSNFGNRNFVRKVTDLLGRSGEIPVQGIAYGPNHYYLNDLMRSDHQAFVNHGIPGVLLHDMATGRTPPGKKKISYHSPNDVISTLNFSAMANFTRAVRKMLENWE